MACSAREAGSPDAATANVPRIACDANVLAACSRDIDAGVDRLVALARRGYVTLVIPSGVVAELRHPRAPDIGMAVADRALVLSARPSTARQHIDRIRVRAILRGDGRAGKHDADAAHLSDASEAGCTFFVTRDGKVLRKRDILASAMSWHMRIVTVAEFLAWFDSDP